MAKSGEALGLIKMIEGITKGFAEGLKDKRKYGIEQQKLKLIKEKRVEESAYKKAQTAKLTAEQARAEQEHLFEYGDPKKGTIGSKQQQLNIEKAEEKRSKAEGKRKEEEHSFEYGDPEKGIKGYKQKEFEQKEEEIKEEKRQFAEQEKRRVLKTDIDIDKNVNSKNRFLKDNQRNLSINTKKTNDQITTHLRDLDDKERLKANLLLEDFNNYTIDNPNKDKLDVTREKLVEKFGFTNALLDTYEDHLYLKRDTLTQNKKLRSEIDILQSQKSPERRSFEDNVKLYTREVPIDEAQRVEDYNTITQYDIADPKSGPKVLSILNRYPADIKNRLSTELLKIQNMQTQEIQSKRKAIESKTKLDEVIEMSMSKNKALRARAKKWLGSAEGQKALAEEQAKNATKFRQEYVPTEMEDLFGR